MHEAFRLLQPEMGIEGGTEKVDSQWLRRTPEDEARGYAYVCNVKGCEVPVRPVYPKALLRSGGSRVHHFAPRGVIHRGHGKKASTAVAGADSSQIADASAIPTHWRDPRDRPTSGTKIGSDGQSFSGDMPATGQSKNKDRQVRGDAQLTTNDPQSLVRSWERFQPHIQEKVLHGFSNRGERWRAVFRSIEDPEMPRLAKQGIRRVWYGRVENVQRYGAKAINIQFAHQRADAGAVSCYIDVTTPSTAFDNTNLERVLQARGRNDRMVYIVGFIREKEQGFAIQTTGLSLVVVT